MPVITIWGMPGNTGHLAELTQSIKTAIENVPILGINSSDVFVFYPVDLLQEGLGDELNAQVNLLYILPERTSEVLQALRDAVIDCLQSFALDYLPQCTYVEVAIASMVKPEDCSVRRLERKPEVEKYVRKTYADERL